MKKPLNLIDVGHALTELIGHLESCLRYSHSFAGPLNLFKQALQYAEENYTIESISPPEELKEDTELPLVQADRHEDSPQRPRPPSPLVTEVDFELGN